MNYSLQDMETARLAGFFDGEGSICICKCNKSKFSPTYIVSMSAFQLTKNDAILHDMVRLFGGKVVSSKKNYNGHFGLQPMSRWEMGQSGIINVLSSMFPYLRVKQRQAFIAMFLSGHIQVVKKERRFGSKLTTEDLKVRDALYRMCRFFNSSKSVSQGVAPA